MSTDKAKEGRIRRLQIRFTVDEHMEDFEWLLSLPERIRGREALAEMRFGRRVRKMSEGFSGIMAPVAGNSSLPIAAARAQEQRAPVGTRADLSDEAADNAQLRVDVSFFAAVPPTQ